MNPQPAAATSATGREPGLQLSCGYGTDRGLRRELNEDSFIASDPVFAVADGMGGHEAGEIASGICVRTLAGMPQLATGRGQPRPLSSSSTWSAPTNGSAPPPGPGPAPPSPE